MADTINAERDDKLAALNSATLGVEMPQITLPDGSKVQTGTVGLAILLFLYLLFPSFLSLHPEAVLYYSTFPKISAIGDMSEPHH